DFRTVEDYGINIPFRALQALGCKGDAVTPNKKKGERKIRGFNAIGHGQLVFAVTGHGQLLLASTLMIILVMVITAEKELVCVKLDQTEWWAETERWRQRCGD
ncbi:predicted protein, partial [Arabidopsis lyrata subsp. lyrata]